MQACTLLPIHKVLSYALVHGTALGTRQPPESTQTGELRLCAAISLLWTVSSFPLLQSFLHSQYLSHSHSLHPLSSRIRRPCLPLALMLMHSQSGCPLSSRALHVHQARPKACMQIRSNCSAVQTPWNLLWGRPWVIVSEMQGKKWTPAHLFYANENKKAKHYKGLSVS